MTVLAFARGKTPGEAAPPAQPAPPPAHARLSYLAHFGLTDLPFGLTPDTDFFCACGPHQEALNTLLYALESGEGFIRVIGEVGTGKTLLCRTLMARLPPDCHALYLPNPGLDPAGILLAVADELGLELPADEPLHRVQRAIQARLIELARCGIRAVLLIDEAQAMPQASLETVRLLSNLETEKRKLLSIVLLGQPELDTRLDAIPQFKTRISFHDSLRPLMPGELAGYLTHRLRRAGLDPAAREPFTPGAVRALHRASGGVPRVVNILAHKALLLAYGKDLPQARRREIAEAAADTLAARAPGWMTWGRWLGLVAVAAATTVAAGWMGLAAQLGSRLAGWLP